MFHVEQNHSTDSPRPSVPRGTTSFRKTRWYSDYQDPSLHHILAEFCPDGGALQVKHWSARLERFTGLLSQWSQRVSLISSGDRSQIPGKHILPSVALRQLILTLPHRAVWDVGSGAGLPGIPLAITLPQTSFLLIESRRRRASFLREVIRRLSLNNTSVLHERLEQDTRVPEGLPMADVVLSRAALNPDRLRCRVKRRTQPHAVLISTLPPSAQASLGKSSLVHRWQCAGWTGSASIQSVVVD